MTDREIYKLDIPLKQDKKGRYYLPNHLFCDALDEETILVNTPATGVTVYKVHANKDGSRWIKGDNIAKYWFDKIFDTPNRLFLDKDIVAKFLKEVNT